jgi:hypothetical protein
VIASAGRVIAFAGGIVVVWYVLRAVIRTVVLPRGEPVVLTRLVFIILRRPFVLFSNRAKTYEARDHSMALYAPTALVVLPGVWVAGVLTGFTAIFWGLGVDPLTDAFYLSGSSVLTLGFDSPPTFGTHVAVFVEATLGLGLVAMLISYLPTIYSAFQRRELAVTRLATRAGDPPRATEMIARHQLLLRLEALDDFWDGWEAWFADVEETHTSFPSLVFFRSIAHDRSWITSAGVVLDAASFRAAVLDLPPNAPSQLCIRAGYLALRRIAHFYSLPFNPDPTPDDPISIDRSEFVAAYQELAAAGVPLRPDVDAAWRDWKGWRVNYDEPLLGLAGLTIAPYAPWSSDRSLAARRLPLTRLGRRAREHK